MKTTAHKFPSYSIAERRTDSAIHVVGIIAAPAASMWLLYNATGLLLTISLAIYCTGLIAMLIASAIYNLLPPIPSKEVARRMDHAVIFIMIAGTYTPFAVNRLPGYAGVFVGSYVWIVAALGVVLAFAYPHNYQRFKFALYLVLGWTAVTVIRPFTYEVQGTTLMLLLAGGLIYSVGAGVHILQRGRFHNAVWHGLVLLAASLHFVAIKTEFIR